MGEELFVVPRGEEGQACEGGGGGGGRGGQDPFRVGVVGELGGENRAILEVRDGFLVGGPVGQGPEGIGGGPPLLEGGAVGQGLEGLGGGGVVGLGGGTEGLRGFTMGESGEAVKGVIEVSDKEAVMGVESSEASLGEEDSEGGGVGGGVGMGWLVIREARVG